MYIDEKSQVQKNTKKNNNIAINLSKAKHFFLNNKYFFTEINLFTFLHDVTLIVQTKSGIGTLLHSVTINYG